MDKTSTMILLTLIIISAEVFASPKLHPIILIPGDGGSQVEARINKTEVVHYICSKTSDWFDLWLNIEQMIPEIIDCWVDNMKLIYHNDTRTTTNNYGVETRIPGFGNTSTVEYLDPSHRGFSVYFANIVKYLIPLGYKRGDNLHGAPYDFRKAANEQADYFVRLKKLIEDSYSQNGNMKVVLLVHSMGGPMTLYFLKSQTQTWKDKYIRAMVSLSGVWGGTVRAIKVFAIGDDLGTWIISQKSFMNEQRSSPSLAWLMPSEDFWTEEEVLVQTDKKNMTRKDFQAFFSGLNYMDGYEMFKDVKDLNKGVKAPQVEVFCLHGTGVPTTKKLVYPPGYWPNGKPVLLTGEGDGTVNMRSLKGCLRWRSQQSQPVHHHVFNHTNHLEILRHAEPAEYVKNIIQNFIQESNPHPKIEIIP